jgi:hypothetical protein
MEIAQDRPLNSPPSRPQSKNVIPPATIAPVAGPAIIGDDREMLEQVRKEALQAIDMIEKSLNTGLKVLADLRTAFGRTVRR